MSNPQDSMKPEELLVLNKKDGGLYVRVPAGEFRMGIGKNNDCPKHTVHLDTYYIGLYPVTNRHYQRFVRATGHRKPEQANEGEPVWKNGGFPEAKADHPVVCVDWDDALAYCRWAGGDLPTEAQWEKAACGPEGFLYPWGNEWDPNRCRNNGNRGSETTCSIHNFPEGVSGHGVYHLSGNVFEWCRDYYDSVYYKHSPAKNPMGPDIGKDRVVRGGSWASTHPAGFLAAFRGDIDPSGRGDFLGFRVLLAAKRP